MLSKPLISLLAFAMLCIAATGLRAQQDGAAPPVATPVPPGDVFKALVGDEKEAEAAIRAWLAQGRAEGPKAVARRATGLIRALGAQAKKLDSAALLARIDRVASDAIRLISGASVARLSIDDGFRPGNALIALGFGSSDSAVAPGFDRVMPGDSRIGGMAVRTRAGSGAQAGLHEGLEGIERVELDVPDGIYRVVLMIPGGGDVGSAGEITVNGVVFPLFGTGVPAGEIRLTNRADPVAPTAGADRGGLRAVVLEGTARDGKLIIEMRGFGNNLPPLAGLLVESAAAPSDFVQSSEFAQALVPLELRFALEEDILSAAAAVLGAIAPAADSPPRLVDLPPPVLDPQELASVSG